MKNLLLIILLGCSTFIQAQNAYYDAITLSEMMDNQGKFRSIIDPVNPTDKSPVYIEILKNYYPEYESLDDNEFKDTLRAMNPFLQPYVNPGAGLAPETTNARGRISLPSIAGLDVTNIATGLSRFLIERANQEINILFFEKFKEFLEENEELRTLFPNSTKFILNTEPYQYARFMQAFKEAYKEDIKDLVNNMEELIKLDRYQEIGIKYPEVYAGILAAVAVSKLSNGGHIADVIKELGEFDNEKITEQQVNLYSGIKLLSILSESIRSNVEGRGWVSWQDLTKNIIEKEIELNIFMGLVYAQTKSIAFEGSAGNVTVGEVLEQAKDLSEDLKKSLEYFKIIEVKIVDANSLLDQIRKKKADSEAVQYTDYYHYFNANIEVIEAFLDIDKFTIPLKLQVSNDDFNDHKKGYITLLKTGNQIYKNVNENNYTSAILNFVIIYDQIIGQKADLLNKEFVDASNANRKKQKEYLQRVAVSEEVYSGKVKKTLQNYGDTTKIGIDTEKFMKYGMFMASVAEAEDPDDVKNAIRAAALPAGSASIKKNSHFNMSLQSYVGAFYNFSATENPEKAWDYKFGITAPLGLSFNWRLKGKKTNSSLGLFTSIIDVGAIVGYELKSDTTMSVATSSSDTTLVETVKSDQQYKIELGQIFSPGVNVVWGLPWKVPLTLGVGIQYGPGLWTFDKDEPVIGKPDWRVKAFLAFDIPIFTIVNKEEKRRWK